MTSRTKFYINFAVSLQRVIFELRRRNMFIVFLIALPLRLLYRVYTLFILNMDLPTSVRIGQNLKIHHGFGLVVSARVTIGNNVVLRQNTTIGVIDEISAGPILEDDVQVGANAIIIGPIKIGRGSIVGAGAVVIKDVPPFVTVVGNPARIICRNTLTEKD